MTLAENMLRTAGHPREQGFGQPPFGGQVVEFHPLGLERLGAHLNELPPGRRSCPLHSHAFEEEVFVVLSGVLTVRELPEGAPAYREFQLRAGELIVYPPGTGLAHGFINRGQQMAVFLALSTDAPGEVCRYPDSGKTLLRGLGQVGVWREDAEQAVARARAQARSRPVETLRESARPAHVLRINDLSERDLGGAFGRQLSRAAGATQVFVNQDRLPNGAVTSPLHWHSCDEELVWVLSGRPTLRQLQGRPAKRGAPDFSRGVEQRVQLQPGDLVHFAPHRPLAHQLLNEADEDAVLLVIGTDDPQDLSVFPEQGRVYSKALGQGGVLNPTEYWAGEN